MNNDNNNNSNSNTVLDKDIIEMIALSQETVELDDALVSKMKGNLMQKIVKNNESEDNSFDTVAQSNTDGWIEAFPGGSFKVLKGDPSIPNSLLSYLIKLEPGFTMGGHDHPFDEETLIIEGDLTLGNKTFDAGDYHFAKAGSSHGNISTKKGCIAFMRGVLPV